MKFSSRFMIFILAAVMLFGVALTGCTTTSPVSDPCTTQFYKGYGTNAKLMWWNVTRGVRPVTNAEAIVMWQNNLIYGKAADKPKFQAAITEAQGLDQTAQAKNPLFDPARFEDKPDLFWACKNG